MIINGNKKIGDKKLEIECNSANKLFINENIQISSMWRKCREDSGKKIKRCY